MRASRSAPSFPGPEPHGAGVSAPDLDEPESGAGVVRAVERALDVLSAFSAERPDLPVADLVQRTGLSRPTVYRLLRTLERKGFVAASGDPQRFALGPAIARLAHVWSATADVAAVARPVMAEAWKISAETVALFVPRGDTRLCVAEMQSPQALSFRRGVGYSEKLVRGASGRAILAFTPLERARLQAYAAGTGVDVAWVWDQLAQTRERGYAMGHNELIQGAYAVAAPFFDGTAQVAGSLGIFGPDVRLTEERIHDFGQILKGLAARLTASLGGALPR